MKIKIVILSIMFILLFSFSIYADVEGDKTMFKELFTHKEVNIGELFSDSFLKQVPEASIVQILNNYRDKLGSFKNAEKSQDGYNLVFTKGTAPAKINLDNKGEISGLWFGAVSLFEDNFTDILSEFEKIEGDVSIYITSDNQDEILTYNENQKLAVGSTFKLYVLKTLYKTIEGKEKSWDDIIQLKNENMSLPSGILQSWPLQSPLTVSTMANLMISLSDNTATDHLIDYIGREKIEDYVDDCNKPFLKTIEAFKLKYGVSSDLRKRYIEGNIETKEDVLSEIKNEDVVISDISDEVSFINYIEWFFSTKELCQTIYDLKDIQELRLNPGLVSKNNWYFAGYKGGSEPGVLQYTHILQKEVDAPIYAVSVTVNNKNGVDENQVTELTSRLISLLK